MEGLSFALATQLQLNGRLPGPKSRAVDCIICLEPFPDSLMVTAPCSHSYCFSDFKELFMRACKDEQLFPPRCCRQELSLDLILPLLNNQEANEFLDKSDEYNCKDRTYCSKPSCSHFISAGNISREIATCTECRSRTCTLCKKEEHGSGDCPDDPSMKLTLETAAANGWQRCQQCHALLEKTHGCQHMTCRCKAEWCYGCGTKWKTCECSVWDESHLYRRAEDLAIRDLGAGAGASALAIAAGAIREDLIANHECTHTGGWEFLRSGAICELCMDYLPNFIFVCAGCRMMACNRCHVNRI